MTQIAPLAASFIVCASVVVPYSIWVTHHTHTAVRCALCNTKVRLFYAGFASHFAEQRAVHLYMCALTVLIIAHVLPLRGMCVCVRKHTRVWSQCCVSVCVCMCCENVTCEDVKCAQVRRVMSCVCQANGDGGCGGEWLPPQRQYKHTAVYTALVYL